jgi:GNAT superfamily N-acetyltransferase
VTVLAERDGYSLDDDPARVDVDAVHAFLRTAYWSTNVPREVVAKAIEGSLIVGLYAADGRQVGFARAVTDRATFAWIGDVYVLESERGRGLGRFLVESLLAHPELQGLRRVMLATADAHSLYRSYGFTDLADPSSYLVIQRSPGDIYRN